jgi:hypothetical protein
MSKRNFKNAITALQGKEQRGEESILSKLKDYCKKDAAFLRNSNASEDRSAADVYDHIVNWIDDEIPPPKKQGDNGKEGEG